MVQDTFRRFAEEQGPARRRARAPHQRRHPRGRHQRAGRARHLRALRARGVRRLRRRRRGRLHGHGRRHRGAVPRLARRRRLAHHPARDPHPGAGEGRHRGAEARVAAEAGVGRDHGRGRRHRARLRLRRRPASRSPPPTRRRRLGHQRREDVVHVRGPRRRAHAAGPHRPRPQSKTHRGLSLFVVPKERGEGHGFEFTQDGGGKMEGRAIDTIGYRGMHSYEVAFDGWRVPADNLIGGDGGRGPGLLPADGGLRERPAADGGPGRRRHAGRLRGGRRLRRRTGSCSASPSATTS